MRQCFKSSVQSDDVLGFTWISALGREIKGRNASFECNFSGVSVQPNRRTSTHGLVLVAILTLSAIRLNLIYGGTRAYFHIESGSGPMPRGEIRGNCNMFGQVLQSLEIIPNIREGRELVWKVPRGEWEIV